MNDALIAARLHLVRLYHAHPQGWPDGIDTKWDRWYTTNKAYWDKLAIEQTVTKTVTEIPSTVTKTPVTKTPGVTKTPTEVVSRLKQVGRPRKEKTATAADRARAYREKRKKS